MLKLADGVEAGSAVSPRVPFTDHGKGAKPPSFNSEAGVISAREWFNRSFEATRQQLALLF